MRRRDGEGKEDGGRTKTKSLGRTGVEEEVMR